MQQTMITKGSRLFGMTALAVSMAATPLLASAQSRYRLSALESGTVIPVKLDNNLSSNDSQKGDTFTATLKTDNGDSYNGLPSGTRIEGVIRTARAKQDKNPGVLDLDFRRLRLPDGYSYPIQGSLIGLDNKSVDRTDDGRIVAKPGHRNDRLTYAGIGAGAGLVVSVLTKRGVLGDTLLGGGLGYLFGSLQKGQSNVRDVALKSGTEMGVRLDRRVSFADYNNDDSRPSRNNQGGYRTDDDTRFHRTPRPGDDANRSDANRNDGNRADGSRPDAGSDRIIDAPTRGDYNHVAGSGTIGVLVGDDDVRFASTARPILSKGVTLVPAKPVLSAAKASYDYNAARKTMTATGQGGTVRVTAGSRVAIINGNRRVLMEAPAQRLNGTLYVPVRFFTLVTNRKATFDADSRTVILLPNGDDGDR